VWRHTQSEDDNFGDRLIRDGEKLTPIFFVFNFLNVCRSIFSREFLVGGRCSPLLLLDQRAQSGHLILFALLVAHGSFHGFDGRAYAEYFSFEQIVARGEVLSLLILEESLLLTTTFYIN